MKQPAPQHVKLALQLESSDVLFFQGVLVEFEDKRERPNRSDYDMHDPFKRHRATFVRPEPPITLAK